MTASDVIGQFLSELDTDRLNAAQSAAEAPAKEMVAEEAVEEPVVLIPSIVTYRRFKT